MVILRRRCGLCVKVRKQQHQKAHKAVAHLLGKKAEDSTSIVFAALIAAIVVNQTVSAEANICRANTSSLCATYLAASISRRR